MKAGVPLLAGILGWAAAGTGAAEFRAAAHTIDVTPATLPAIRNGGFLEEQWETVADPLLARCLVLASGNESLALAVVDSCMIPRDLCDRAKRLASERTGIPVDRILISATHTHSAPGVMEMCLGSRMDEAYAAFLVPRIAEGIVRAHANLEPAEAGWAVAQAPDHTHCRRWLCQPDAHQADPFGEKTVRAMMHPGYQNPKFSGPAGPVDPALTMLSVRSRTGRPLALLANYSMHYFGTGRAFSADYFGAFAREMERRIGKPGNDGPPFVAMLSQGTSGDLHWMNYGQSRKHGYTMKQYTTELANIALQDYKNIDHDSDPVIAMRERRLTLDRRQPDVARLKWADELNARRGDRRPRNRPEVYADQAAWLTANPTEEIVLQAIRIGSGGITACPNEVYGITGLKLKAQSPVPTLMNVTLANGAAGYIPPPEQHFLGGYTTWPARTAGLEVNAEPRIVDGLLGLLEDLSGKPRLPLATDFYTDAQRAAIERAGRDDNNRRNRGKPAG